MEDSEECNQKILFEKNVTFGNYDQKLSMYQDVGYGVLLIFIDVKEKYMCLAVSTLDGLRLCTSLDPLLWTDCSHLFVRGINQLPCVPQKVNFRVSFNSTDDLAAIAALLDRIGGKTFQWKKEVIASENIYLQGSNGLQYSKSPASGTSTVSSTSTAHKIQYLNQDTRSESKDQFQESLVEADSYQDILKYPIADDSTGDERSKEIKTGCQLEAKTVQEILMETSGDDASYDGNILEDYSFQKTALEGAIYLDTDYCVERKDIAAIDLGTNSSIEQNATDTNTEMKCNKEKETRTDSQELIKNALGGHIDKPQSNCGVCLKRTTEFTNLYESQRESNEYLVQDVADYNSSRTSSFVRSIYENAFNGNFYEISNADDTKYDSFMVTTLEQQHIKSKSPFTIGTISHSTTNKSSVDTETRNEYRFTEDKFRCVNQECQSFRKIFENKLKCTNESLCTGDVIRTDALNTEVNEVVRKRTSPLLLAETELKAGYDKNLQENIEFQFLANQRSNYENTFSVLSVHELNGSAAILQKTSDIHEHTLLGADLEESDEMQEYQYVSNENPEDGTSVTDQKLLSKATQTVDSVFKPTQIRETRDTETLKQLENSTDKEYAGDELSDEIGNLSNCELINSSSDFLLDRDWSENKEIKEKTFKTEKSTDNKVLEHNNSTHGKTQRTISGNTFARRKENNSSFIDINKSIKNLSLYENHNNFSALKHKTNYKETLVRVRRETCDISDTSDEEYSGTFEAVEYKEGMNRKSILNAGYEAMYEWNDKRINTRYKLDEIAKKQRFISLQTQTDKYNSFQSSSKTQDAEAEAKHEPKIAVSSERKKKSLQISAATNCSQFNLNKKKDCNALITPNLYNVGHSDNSSDSDQFQTRKSKEIKSGIKVATNDSAAVLKKGKSFTVQDYISLSNYQRKLKNYSHRQIRSVASKKEKSVGNEAFHSFNDSSLLAIRGICRSNSSASLSTDKAFAYQEKEISFSTFKENEYDASIESSISSMGEHGRDSSANEEKHLQRCSSEVKCLNLEKKKEFDVIKQKHSTRTSDSCCYNFVCSNADVLTLPNKCIESKYLEPNDFGSEDVVQHKPRKGSRKRLTTFLPHCEDEIEYYSDLSSSSGETDCTDYFDVSDIMQKTYNFKIPTPSDFCNFALKGVDYAMGIWKIISLGFVFEYLPPSQYFLDSCTEFD